jgi:oxygen-independent coproporphyrinogen-3 oxidase
MSKALELDGGTDERPSLVDFGVYVHFPWCLSKCPYCDFVAYGVPRESIDHSGYADAVVAELAARREAWAGRRLRTVFFGGGTPSLWEPAELARVLAAIRSAFPAATGAVEVSAECDPSSLDRDRARALVDAGVDRLSIGVQALDDERLKFLGRIHTAREARDSVGAAVAAGVPRVSADLMYAVAGQNAAGVAGEARELAGLGATHVSAYSLTIEPDTPFGHLARRGRLPLCDDGAAVATFFAIDEALAEAGLEHYEVSNYAKEGERARHNLAYWRGSDYLGLGCGAYGTISQSDRSALRYRNQPNPRSYMARARDVLDGLAASEEHLDPPTRLRERIMLGLRMKEGLELEAAAADLGTDPYPDGRRAALDRLEARGRIVRNGSHLAVPREAWIWADDTAASLF